MTRVDLHLHSNASLTAGEWFSKYFGCPESYVDPVAQYNACKARGMNLVTLTDHDTIEGGLQLMDRPDFFLSEEVSTKFPENGCVMHVLVWNLTPDQHAVIAQIRRNVYDLVPYLRQQGLAHGLAHPLLSPNWKLDAETLEKCLVLFPALERRNGMCDQRLDRDMAHLIDSISPGILASLAKKHNLSLPPMGPRFPALFGGSDDHVNRRSGLNYTEVDGEVDATTFFRKVMAGEGRPVGTPGDLNIMAMSIYSTSHEHLRQRSDFRASRRDILVDFADLLAGREKPTDPNHDHVIPDVRDSLLRAAAQANVGRGPALDMTTIPTANPDQTDAAIMDAVAKVADGLFAKGLGALAEAVVDWDVYQLFVALRELGTALAVSTPALFAANDFGNQYAQVERVWKNWTAFPAPARDQHLAVFSDSLNVLDGGVAAWCARFGSAAASAHRQVWFATCGTEGGESDLNTLPTVARFEVPFYDGFELVIPSLTATIARMWKLGVTHVELSTPGPVGIIGLLAARLLGLPVTSSYHTDLPDLLRALTGHNSIGRGCERYLGYFYRAVDRVFAFSPASRTKLVAMGVPEDRIGILPSAVDPGDFSPDRRSASAFAAHGLDFGDQPIVLSVGRVSAEKNLPMAIEAVGLLQDRSPAPRIVIVGDGPERKTLEEQYKDTPFVSFLGFQSGDTLRALYASASVFAFTSKVDTLGLVNLEALASGLPILVPDDSAIAAFLQDGENALTYPYDAASLAGRIRLLLDHPELRHKLSVTGRQYSLERWERGGFDQLWEGYLQATADRHSSTSPS